jgi:hypothetical protein
MLVVPVSVVMVRIVWRRYYVMVPMPMSVPMSMSVHVEPPIVVMMMRLCRNLIHDILLYYRVANRSNHSYGHYSACYQADVTH